MAEDHSTKAGQLYLYLFKHCSAIKVIKYWIPSLTVLVLLMKLCTQAFWITAAFNVFQESYQ